MSSTRHKRFFYKHFKYWLKANRHLFNCTPYIRDVKRGSFRVYFNECASYLYLNVSSGGDCSFYSYYKYKDHQKSKDRFDTSDWVADFDTYIKRDSFGLFYCFFCDGDDHKAERFISKEALLIKHTYFPFLKWCNERIIKNKHIVFFAEETKVGDLQDILHLPSNYNREVLFIHKIN